MHSSKVIDIGISKSSIVGLKAELLKKQEEVKRIKEKQQDHNTEPIVKLKTNNVDLQKSRGRTKKKCVQENKYMDEDSFEVLKKSREVLEAKSRLYDKLKESCGDVNKKGPNYLIDFNLKHEIDQQERDLNNAIEESNKSSAEDEENDYSDSDDPLDDWVDYVDTLGRSRRCLRKDLPEMKVKDSGLAKYLEPPPPIPVAEPTPELLSWDMQREIMRKKWEEQEALLLNKNDIHYQDVLFDEARAHGVGYFEFSSDETERLKQQEALASMRKETLEQQQSAQGLRARRQQQLQARLAAARKRRRERLGLPDPEPDSLESENTLPEVEHDDKPTEEEKVEDIEEAIKRIAPVRPWDIGKQINNPVLSQEEWVEKKRQERPVEFAPPSFLLEDKNLKFNCPNQLRHEQTTLYKNIQRDKRENSGFLKNSPTSEYSNTNPQRSWKPTSEDIDNFLLVQKEKHFFKPETEPKSQGVGRAPVLIDRKLDEKERSNTISSDQSDSLVKVPFVDDRSTEQATQSHLDSERSFCKSSYSSNLYQKTSKSKRQTNMLNVDEFSPKSGFEDITTSSFNSSSSVSSKRKWAEIAPPPIMDYYSGESVHKKPNKGPKIDMANSVSVGLDHLKTLSQEKNQKRIKGLLDIV